MKMWMSSLKNEEKAMKFTCNKNKSNLCKLLHSDITIGYFYQNLSKR